VHYHIRVKGHPASMLSLHEHCILVANQSKVVSLGLRDGQVNQITTLLITQSEGYQCNYQWELL
jgi:hypothetical protein